MPDVGHSIVVLFMIRVTNESKVWRTRGSLKIQYAQTLATHHELRHRVRHKIDSTVAAIKRARDHIARAVTVAVPKPRIGAASSACVVRHISALGVAVSIVLALDGNYKGNEGSLASIL